MPYFQKFSFLYHILYDFSIFMITWLIIVLNVKAPLISFFFYRVLDPLISNVSVCSCPSGMRRVTCHLGVKTALVTEGIRYQPMFTCQDEPNLRVRIVYLDSLLKMYNRSRNVSFVSQIIH